MKNVERMSIEKFKVYLQFLIQSDIITFTLEHDDDFNVIDWIYNHDNSDITIKNFFDRVLICFKYPMFYYNLIGDLTDQLDATNKFISGSVLGSILECDVRGIWSDFTNSLILHEYHLRAVNNDCIGEIDIYDDIRKIGIEITIRNKNSNEIILNKLPPTFRKILFTKNKIWKDGNNIAAPYPKLTLELTRKSR